MKFLLMISVFIPAVFANSESEKWSWPSTADDQKPQATNRKDIYYENTNSNEKAGRIRVPTSYDDRRRPLQQPYQVRDPAANKPKPLSDEFSNESSGENYSNNINGYNGNRPSGNTGNRFGPQQSNDFLGQFGYGQQYPGGFPGGPFPGAYGGQGFYPGQFPGGQYPIGAGGYPGYNAPNGILVGPGGPTGIIGRPPFGGGYYGGQGNYPGAGFGGGFPGAGFGGGFPGAGFGGGFPGGVGFDGHNNGIGGSPYGGKPGISPYNPQFGNGYGPFQRPFLDSTSNNNSQDKKVEKSAKSTK